VAKVDPENNLLYIRGAVPGGKNGVVVVIGVVRARHQNSSAIVDAVLMPVPEISITVFSRPSMTPRSLSFANAAATLAEVAAEARGFGDVVAAMA
jgi:hypothetical protein